MVLAEELRKERKDGEVLRFEHRLKRGSGGGGVGAERLELWW